MTLKCIRQKLDLVVYFLGLCRLPDMNIYVVLEAVTLRLSRKPLSSTNSLLMSWSFATHMAAVFLTYGSSSCTRWRWSQFKSGSNMRVGQDIILQEKIKSKIFYHDWKTRLNWSSGKQQNYTSCAPCKHQPLHQYLPSFTPSCALIIVLLFGIRGLNLCEGKSMCKAKIYEISVHMGLLTMLWICLKVTHFLCRMLWRICLQGHTRADLGYQAECGSNNCLCRWQAHWARQNHVCLYKISMAIKKHPKSIDHFQNVP